MQSLFIRLTQKSKSSLHLLLVVGVVLYLFSPLLDHWLGYENYARPHTHVHLFENSSTTALNTYKFEADVHLTDHHEHDESFLCLLDVNALFYVALNINIAVTTCTVQNAPLIFDLPSSYLQVSTIYLSSLDPPPRIYA